MSVVSQTRLTTILKSLFVLPPSKISSHHQSKYSMDPDSNSISAIDLLLQARLLLEIILHPTSCLAVLHNWKAFYTTRMPEKLMYFSSTGWIDLPSETLEAIKKCFEQRSMAIKVDIDGIQVVANLLGMVLVDSSGRMRSIAWVDTDGKPFFPKKIFGGGIVRAPQILEEARPSFGSLADLRRLEETDDKYRKVKNTFLKGMKGNDREAKVSAMYSCTQASAFGASRLRAFERMAEIINSAKTFKRLRYGWYGADPTSMEAIITRGFGLEDALCGVNGAGIYFSTRDYPCLSACYSRPDANGEYHVLLCQVILGTVEKITHGSKQYAPSREDYDNGIDDLKNPRWLIIWTANMSTHIIPRYLVSFKVSQLTQERWRRLQRARSSRLQRLPTPIPLRPQVLLPRCPRYLERYQRNKNNLTRGEF